MKGKEKSLIPKHLMLISYFLLILYIIVPIYNVYVRASLAMLSCLLLGFSWLRIGFLIMSRKPFILGMLLIFLAPLTIALAKTPLGFTPITLGGFILALASYIIHIYAYLDFSSEIKEEKLEIVAALYGILLILGILIMPVANEALSTSWRFLSFLSSSRRVIWCYVIPDISSLILILIASLTSEPIVRSLIMGLSAVIAVELTSLIALAFTIYRLIKISKRS